MSGRSEADLVIVGAGAAGLAAGLAARAGGLDVVIVEAAGRIGGRALTDKTGLPSGPYDIGCHWMHDASENPLAALALTHGKALRNQPHPDGVPRWLTIRGAVMDAATRADCAAYYLRCFAAMEEAGAAGADRVGAEVLDTASPYYPLFQGWAGAIYGVPPERISTGDLARQMETPENWPLAQGYGAMIAEILGDQPVTLDCPVRRIDRAGKRMRVETAQGAIEADDIILAVSSTVLAEGAIAFTPGLPADVLSAIEAVPLGHAERVGIALTQRLDGIEDQVPGHVLTKGGEHIGLMIHEFGRPELTGYLSGDLARDLGRAGKEAAFAFLRDALKEVFGADIEKRITGWVASQWAGDPLIRGAYSHAVPGRAHLRPRLAEPVEERLHLAGEATHPTRFASAHGAYMSGLRAVGQVMARRKRAGLVGHPMSNA